MSSFLKNMLYLKSYSARLFTGMLLLVVVIVVTMAFFQGEMVYQALIKAREQKLIALAEHLAKRLPERYEEISRRKVTEKGKKEEQIREMKEELQEQVSSRPDTGMGYYDLQINSAVTRP